METSFFDSILFAGKAISSFFLAMAIMMGIAYSEEFRNLETPKAKRILTYMIVWMAIRLLFSW